MLATGAKIQCLGTIFRVEALYQFGLFSSKVECVNPLNVEDIVLGLALYFSPVNSLSNQKRLLCHGMRKPRGLKFRRYAVCLIGINKYLDSFPGATLADQIVSTELNGIFLNSMPNSWNKQAFVQGFYCENITFKNLLTCLSTWIFLNLFIKV